MHAQLAIASILIACVVAHEKGAFGKDNDFKDMFKKGRSFQPVAQPWMPSMALNRFNFNNDDRSKVFERRNENDDLRFANIGNGAVAARAGMFSDDRFRFSGDDRRGARANMFGFGDDFGDDVSFHALMGSQMLPQGQPTIRRTIPFRGYYGMEADEDGYGALLFQMLLNQQRMQPHTMFPTPFNQMPPQAVLSNTINSVNVPMGNIYNPQMNQMNRPFIPPTMGPMNQRMGPMNPMMNMQPQMGPTGPMMNPGIMGHPMMLPHLQMGQPMMNPFMFNPFMRGMMPMPGPFMPNSIMMANQMNMQMKQHMLMKQMMMKHWLMKHWAMKMKMMHSMKMMNKMNSMRPNMMSGNFMASPLLMPMIPHVKM